MLRFIFAVVYLLTAHAFRGGLLTKATLSAGMRTTLSATTSIPSFSKHVDEKQWPGCKPEAFEAIVRSSDDVDLKRRPSFRDKAQSSWPGIHPSTRHENNKPFTSKVGTADKLLSHRNTKQQYTKKENGAKRGGRSISDSITPHSAPKANLTPSQKYAQAIKQALNPTTAKSATLSDSLSTYPSNPTASITTTTASTTTGRKKNTLEEEQPSMQELLAAMENLKFSKRQYDPEIETDHPDDQLGFVSDTFRSGFVSILGNANVGKSTLLNHLLEQDLSIVSPKPQTTRHQIFGILTRMPTNTTMDSDNGTGSDGSGSNDGIDSSHSSAGAQTATTQSSPAGIPTIPIPTTLEQFKREGYQLVIADTPGMLTPSYKLQEVMQSTVRSAEREGDVVLVVTDVYGEPLQDNKIMDKLKLTTRPVVVAINKVDIARKDNVGAWNTTTLPFPVHLPDTEPEAELEYGPPDPSTSTRTSTEEEKRYNVALSYEALKQLWQTRLPNAQIVGISAKLGTGVPWLLYTLLRHVRPGPLYYPRDHVADRDERFFATEIVRECLLELYHEEIPYSCEVVMESFEDKGDDFSVLSAAVVVSRKSQKGIIIGAKGNKLRELGTLARKKLEKFLGRKVYLNLRVKVDEEWRSKDAALTKYGYIQTKG